MAIGIPFNFMVITGIVLFLSLFATAVAGSLVLRGTRGFTLGRHRIMAWITFVLALVHGFFAFAWYLGL